MHTSKCKSSLIKTKCRNTLLIFFLNPVGNIPKNGGQIIKQLLADENYDLSRFTCVKQAEVIRRKKLRLVYTDFIHHPHDTLNFWYLPLKCILARENSHGNYQIPGNYQILVMTN